MKNRTKKMVQSAVIVFAAIALVISAPGCASRDDTGTRQSDGHTGHTH